MAHQATRRTSVTGDDLPEPLSPSASTATPDATVRPENAFSEAGGATVAALLHLLRLMGAELVLMRGTTVAQLEQAVRGKIGEFVSPTANPAAREAGLAQARYLVEQVLTQIKAQAELKKSLAVEPPSPPQASVTTPSHPVSKLLN
jgi:hypothetical protein